LIPFPKVFGSRVGRRVLLLLFVTAITPLALMALFSLSQVRSLLLVQGSGRLANTAKVYATDVYDRLSTARSTAMLSAAKSAIPASLSRAITESFVFLAVFSPDGHMNVRLGTAPPEMREMVEEYRGSLSGSEALLRRTDSGRLFLLQRAAPGKDGEIVAGELAPGYVWGSEYDLQAGMIVCVVDGDSLAYLHCPGGHAMDIPGVVRAGGLGIESRDIAWTDAGRGYRGRVWGQFLLNDFGAPDWYFAMALPEEDILAPVYAFRHIYIPILLLALLLIVWVSMHQVDMTLDPLGILTASTRRLAANDFSARVEVTSQDEFGELGTAFNTMADHLDRRFRLSMAHAEIDRLILDRADLERIVESTLRHAASLLSMASLRVVMLDQSGSACGRLIRLGGGPERTADSLQIEPICVSADTRPKLSSALLVRFERNESAPDWLPSAEVHGTGPLWICPLVWGKTECGWLLVSCLEENASSDECLRILESLANRLAVAIASAWREVELFQRAHYDILTGLPNRGLFADRLEHEIARGHRDGKALAVMFVDLDRFKSVNDSQGHGAGDALLCEAGNRIGALVREADTVSRRGGDEFTLLLTDIREQRDALPIAQSVIAALSRPFVLNGVECFLSASVGIAIFPDNGATAELLIQHADMAMYRAKAAGRGQAMFFEERMNVEIVARASIDRELRQALERGELVLHYQPQVALKNDSVVSAEALVRWNHPVRGLLGPGYFIPVAEEGQLICAIGRWVIEEACRQMKIWRREGLMIERVSVNVSARQFGEPDFIEHIRRIVVEPGLASSIEFEITESVLVERAELLEGKLNELSDFGCTIALDDFGTGYSSMAYLKKLPVDVVKIDRMFVEDIDQSADARAFVEAMIVMSHVLGKSVVAEGAERDAEVAILRRLGCDLVQGYHFSRPLAATDFAAFATSFGRSDRRGEADTASLSNA